jgi:hypothetical protein
MRVRFFNCFSKRRLTWLLGLLLLMPLAQTAATWHLISHIHQAQASERTDEGSSALVDYCDLCRTAAATSGGLLPTLAASPAAVAVPLAVPDFTFQPLAHKPQWPPYASRAPPFAQT